MKPLKFKILENELIMKHWDDFKRIDQEFIEHCAKKNDVFMDYDHKYEEMTFSSGHDNLYTFLFSVAFRYDIELI